MTCVFLFALGAIVATAACVAWAWNAMGETL